MSLSIPASGIQAAQRKMDVSSNNVANANSTGFQPDRAHQQSATEGGTRSTVDSTSQTLPAKSTGRAMDVHLPKQGDFLQAQQNGEDVLVNGGSLGLDGEGRLVHQASGSLIQDQGGGAIEVPEGTSSVEIGQDGSVQAVGPNGNTQEVGNLNNVSVQNPQGLRNEGGGVYSETANSGEVGEGNGPVLSGMLPGSGTDLVRETVEQLSAEHASAFAVEALETQDEMTGELLDRSA